MSSDSPDKLTCLCNLAGRRRRLVAAPLCAPPPCESGPDAARRRGDRASCGRRRGRARRGVSPRPTAGPADRTGPAAETESGSDLYSGLVLYLSIFYSFY